MKSPVLALAIAVVANLLPLQSYAQETSPTPAKWWKGNLHTHTLWSDGDDYPEMIVSWYKQQGYHFLALSDHNVLLEGSKWIEIAANKGGTNAFKKYLSQYGSSWVEQQQKDGKQLVRLKPLGEFRHLFEEPGRFLLIESQEITDRHLTAPIHINASNIREFVQARGGNSVLEVMQNNVNAVLDQRQKTGQAMIPHVNHPNFGWGITAEELMRVQGERFFEVYNAHPTVHNNGDETHASTEKMWDIILTWRLAILKMDPIFGLAVDDAHNYHNIETNQSNAGHGWVMVRSQFLTPEYLIRAMEAGDFYATSGVRLDEVHHNPQELSLRINPEDGVTYKTQFIGTRKGFDQRNEPIRTTSGEALRVTHRYSEDIGMVFAEVSGTSPSYRFKGDEIYVRAKIISSKPKSKTATIGEMESAWIQPVVLK